MYKYTEILSLQGEDLQVTSLYIMIAHAKTFVCLATLHKIHNYVQYSPNASLRSPVVQPYEQLTAV